MEVLLLSTGHDVKVMSLAEIVHILSVNVAKDIVLVRLLDAGIAIIVVAVRIGRNVGFLLALRVVGTQLGMEMQVFETMNLIVGLDTANPHGRMSAVILQVHQSHGVLGSVGVGDGCVPVVLGGVGDDRLPVAAGCIAVCINGLCGIHTDGSTEHGTIHIAVLRVHVLGVHIQCEVVLEERGREVHATRETLEVTGLGDTVLVGITGRNTIRSIEGGTGHAQLMVSADSGTVNLILPVGVGGSESCARFSEGIDDVVAILVAGEHVVRVALHADRHIAVIRNTGSTVGALDTLLGGDDDHTIGSTATIDGSSRSILQYGEALDVFGVHHSERIAQTLHTTVIHSEAVDHNQRVVGCTQ